MQPNKDHIKEIFSSKLSSFEPKVPTSIWNKIEADLDGLNRPLPKTRFSRKKILKMSSWIVGAAASVLLIFFFYSTSNKSTYNIVASVNDYLLEDVAKGLYSNLNKTIDIDSDKNLKSNQKTEKIDLYKQNAKISKSLSNPYLAKVELPNSIDLLLNSSELSNKDFINEIKEFDNKNKVTKGSKVAVESEKEYLDNLLGDEDVISSINKKSRKKQLGLLGGSSFSSTDDIKKGFDELMPRSEDRSFTKSARETKLDHNQPITIGLSISKQITEKISLETGLVYIYLSSRIKTNNVANIRRHDIQHLHYVGLPISLNYKFAEYNKFKFYLSTGGLIQKDFYGRLSSNTYIDEVLQPNFYTRKKISQKNPQFSVNGGLGISYPVYNRMNIYTNLGAAYSIDANNEYETIYSDKKWLFNIKLGVRFDF